MEELKGLDVATATKKVSEKGDVYRILREDDPIIFATADIRVDRVNLFVKDGKVVGSSRG